MLARAIWICALTTLTGSALAQDPGPEAPGVELPGSAGHVPGPAPEGQAVEPGAEGHVAPEGGAQAPGADEVDRNSVGIMVRVLVAESEADPTRVLLTGADGTEHEIVVHDDGVEGDVEAGDRIWAGSIWVLGDVFEVTIDTASGPLEAGTVSWSATDKIRDLMISVDATQVSAEALVSKPPPGEGTTLGATPAPGEAADGPGSAGGGPPPPPGGAAASGEGGSSALRIAGLLFGLLALGALAWWWRQSSAPAADGPGVPRPDAALLGAGTPSIGDAVTVWTVDGPDAAALVGPLLGTVARGRSVVTHGPTSIPIPPVHGGPVFAADDLDDLGDRLEILVQRGALAAGFVVVNAPTLETLADVEATRPAGAGLVVLAIDPAEGVTGVVCRRNGQRWTLGDVTVRPGPYGFEHPDLVDE